MIRIYHTFFLLVVAILLVPSISTTTAQLSVEILHPVNGSSITISDSIHVKLAVNDKLIVISSICVYCGSEYSTCVLDPQHCDDISLNMPSHVSEECQIVVIDSCGAFAISNFRAICIASRSREIEYLWFKSTPDGLMSTLYAPSFVIDGDYGYVFGGTVSGLVTNAMYRLDIKANTFTALDTLGTRPSARYRHSAVLYDGCIYVFGGYSSLNDLHRFCISTRTWTQMTGPGTVFSGRYDHSAVVIGNKMYVFGGSCTSCNTTAYYDFDSDLWTVVMSSAGNVPGIRHGHSAIAYNGLMYLFGGYQSSYYDTLHTFDPAANTWTLLSPSGIKPTGRYLHSAVVYNGQMVVYGGSCSSSVCSPLFAYDFVGNSWNNVTSIASGTVSSSSHRSYLYKDEMLVLGVSSSTNNKEMYRLTLGPQGMCYSFIHYVVNF